MTFVIGIIVLVLVAGFILFLLNYIKIKEKIKGLIPKKKVKEEKIVVKPTEENIKPSIASIPNDGLLNNTNDLAPLKVKEYFKESKPEVIENKNITDNDQNKDESLFEDFSSEENALIGAIIGRSYSDRL